MALVEIVGVVGYRTSNRGCVCPECFDENQTQIKSYNDLLQRETVESDPDFYYFCDKCGRLLPID